MNLTLWPETNPGCYYDTTHLNSLFLFVVLLPETVLRTILLWFWNTRLYLDQRSILIQIVTPCLYATWFCLAVLNYTAFQPECYQPFPSYSLVLFSV